MDSKKIFMIIGIFVATILLFIVYYSPIMVKFDRLISTRFYKTTVKMFRFFIASFIAFLSYALFMLFFVEALELFYFIIGAIPFVGTIFLFILLFIFGMTEMDKNSKKTANKRFPISFWISLILLVASSGWLIQQSVSACIKISKKEERKNIVDEKVAQILDAGGRDELLLFLNEKGRRLGWLEDTAILDELSNIIENPQNVSGD